MQPTRASLAGRRGRSRAPPCPPRTDDGAVIGEEWRDAFDVLLTRDNTPYVKPDKRSLLHFAEVRVCAAGMAWGCGVHVCVCVVGVRWGWGAGGGNGYPRGEVHQAQRTPTLWQEHLLPAGWGDPRHRRTIHLCPAPPPAPRPAGVGHAPLGAAHGGRLHRGY